MLLIKRATWTISRSTNLVVRVRCAVWCFVPRDPHLHERALSDCWVVSRSNHSEPVEVTAASPSRHETHVVCVEIRVSDFHAHYIWQVNQEVTQLYQFSHLTSVPCRSFSRQVGPPVRHSSSFTCCTNPPQKKRKKSRAK